MAAKKKAEAKAPQGPADLAHMDDVSPEGGYAGLEAEREAAEKAVERSEPEE